MMPGQDIEVWYNADGFAQFVDFCGEAMSIKVYMLPLGPLQTNCFVIGDMASSDAIIIDPSDQADQIMELVEREGLTVRYILATHAHFDHVMAAKAVREATGAPLWLHQDEIEQLRHMKSIAARFGLTAPDPAEHDDTLAEGDVIEVGAIRLETLYTPGHSPGHVSFALRSEQVVFSGDCLFLGSTGRTDLPGGDYDTLMRSIFDKLLPLGDDYTVCPGHGPTTTIGHERATNPVLLGWGGQL